MFKRILLCGLAILFMGCATSQTNTIGGFNNDMASGLTVLHQYHQTASILNKDKKAVYYTTTFKTDLDADLPQNIVKLALAMSIVNPYKQKFEIWERVNFIDVSTGKLYFKSEKLRYPSDSHRLLPEGLISIDLPVYAEQHTQVLFFATVKSNGRVIYTTYTARYKIGSQNN